RAGSTSAQFWNNTTANYLMSKTFHVIPTTNNASGSYQVTLYYSSAEKLGWEGATGQSFSNIQLVKVAGQISQVTPATPAAAGAVTVVTPTVGTYGTGYTLTYTFANGFSGFGAGIPAAALPITLLNFTGQLDNNVIQLNWSTSSEQNSNYFEVQKSVDGTNFYPLGRVSAAGTSTTQRNYGYTDRQVSEQNYYRLAMTDMDGKFVLSNVVLVRNPGVQQQAWVVNNPFSSYIDLRFAKLPAQQVKAELLTVSGATVFSQVYGGAMQLRVDLGFAHLSAGTYILRTTVDGKRFINKVVKQ
ncbi:MAG TPA: T9SS type A sorting domain-containing protein, partial [Chitinophagaceae bacterium]